MATKDCPTCLEPPYDSTINMDHVNDWRTLINGNLTSCGAPYQFDFYYTRTYKDGVVKGDPSAVLPGHGDPANKAHAFTGIPLDVCEQLLWPEALILMEKPVTKEDFLAVLELYLEIGKVCWDAVIRTHGHA